MQNPQNRGADPSSGPSTGDAWIAIARSPTFFELRRQRRRLVVTVCAITLADYLGFLLLVAFAPEALRAPIGGGLTAGLLLVLAQFAIAWMLAAVFLRISERTLLPLEQAVLREAGVAGASSATAPLAIAVPLKAQRSA